MDGPFQLALGALHERLPVLRLRGVERLSKLHRFDLVVVLAADFDLDTILETDAVLTVGVANGTPRRIGGVVTRVDGSARLADGSRSTKLRLEPHLGRLRLRKSTRIFQELTSVEIAARILAEHNVPLRSDVIAALPKRVYAVQYQETDLAFVERLFAEDGLVTYFEDPPGETVAPETFVVIDAAFRYPIVPDDPALVVRVQLAGAQGSMKLEERHLTAFDTIHRSRTKGAFLRDFDFKRPLTPAESCSEKTVALLPAAHVYEHTSAYGEDQPVLRADVVRDQVTRRRSTSRGRGLCRRLAPGRRFTADGEGIDGKVEVVAIEVRHDAEVEASGGRAIYESSFEAIDATVLYRPVRPARRIHQALETATVVGPKDEAVYTDSFGRIKVRFHWDREGPHDDGASCWLRVNQTWSGASWGAQFIPRVGMEVIVGFLQGDVDRPIVLGCVDNATHMPPYPLPEERLRSGFKTDSVGSPGYNELSFDDTGGNEEVRVRAQRNMNVHVLQHEQTEVDGNATLSVGGNRSVGISGASTLRIQGESLTELASDAILRTAGCADLRVAGELGVHVGASRHTVVHGADTSEIAGDRTEHVVGAFSVHTDARLMLAVGTDEVTGHADIRSTGALVLTSERRTLVTAAETLTLVCGESVIEMTPSQITFRANDIVLEAKSSIVAKSKGPALELTDTTQILTDEIRILAKSASLELGDKAELKGSSISMGKNEPKPPSESSAQKDDTKTIKVQFTDPQFNPYAGRKWVARGEGVRLEGTTGGDGGVELDVPKSCEQILVTLWLADYPTGPRREYSLQLDDLPGLDTIPGLQHRLLNLGYYTGGTNGDRIDDALEAALRWFQRDHDLPESGQLDDATKSAIERRHGH